MPPLSLTLICLVTQYVPPLTKPCLKHSTGRVTWQRWFNVVSLNYRIKTEEIKKEKQPQSQE